MKKKIKSLIVVSGMLLMSIGLLNAQGLYEKENVSKDDASSSSQSSLFNDGALKGPIGGGGDEPPPVEDSLLAFIAVAGAYGLYIYRKNRYRTKA